MSGARRSAAVSCGPQQAPRRRHGARPILDRDRYTRIGTPVRTRQLPRRRHRASPRPRPLARRFGALTENARLSEGASHRIGVSFLRHSVFPACLSDDTVVHVCDNKMAALSDMAANGRCRAAKWPLSAIWRPMGGAEQQRRSRLSPRPHHNAPRTTSRAADIGAFRPWPQAPLLPSAAPYTPRAAVVSRGRSWRWL
jgi:hypothetical protein